MLDQIPGRKPGTCRRVARIEPGAVEPEPLPVAEQSGVAHGGHGSGQMLRGGESQTEEGHATGVPPGYAVPRPGRPPKDEGVKVTAPHCCRPLYGRLRR